MADETIAAPAVAQETEAPAPTENVTPAAPEASEKEKEVAPSEAPAPDSEEAKEPTKPEEPSEQKDATETSASAEKEAGDEVAAKPAEESTKADEPEKESGKPDTDMKDANGPEASAAGADSAPAEGESSEQKEKAGTDVADAAPAVPATPATGEKATPAKSSTKDRRKSTGAAQSGKKLNKKASKARITHLDAKPGDHYFVKLKGHPKWPIIICDDDMLPQSLLNSRPVTAKRADGTYRDDFADGGKRASDRTYPVMYLYTNEFGWVPNTDLSDLDSETVLEEKTGKMRKDLQAAYDLAAESHDLSFYKEMLADFQQELLEKQRQKEAKAATPAKKKKAKAEVDEDGDVDMEDEGDVDADVEPEVKKSSSKKRKAEETIETPARADSVKKPKIKLHTNSTPKVANGMATTPKSAKTGEAKSARSKKKSKEQEKKEEKEVTPKEPELSPEEKHARKEKEVLFLRHKLQKGLLTRDSEPKEDDMKMMSDYITKLESFPDLEVSIIRATKINKVLKALLKLEHIPKEDEFKFKSRSQVLLDKWNKLLASDGTPAAESANGVNGTTEGKLEKKDKANGVKAQSEGAEAKSEEKVKPEEAAEDKPDGEEEKAQPVEASA